MRLTRGHPSTAFSIKFFSGRPGQPTPRRRQDQSRPLLQLPQSAATQSKGTGSLFLRRKVARPIRATPAQRGVLALPMAPTKAEAGVRWEQELARLVRAERMDPGGAGQEGGEIEGLDRPAFAIWAVSQLSQHGGKSWYAKDGCMEGLSFAMNSLTALTYRFILPANSARNDPILRSMTTKRRVGW